MGRATPGGAVAVIPAAPVGVAAREPSATPLSLTPVTARPPARPRERGWTVMLVPPPRAVARVRSVAVRPWHVILPLVLLATVLAAASLGAAHVAARVFEARVVTEVDVLRGRLETAERSLGVLSDSLAEVSARAERLLASRAAAAASTETGGGSRSAAMRRLASGVVLPVDGRITSRFAPRRMHPVLRINRPHRGLDIAAPSGTPIRAPAAGRVTRVARDFGYGLVVYLDHGNGVTTRYAHLRSAAVRSGQWVTEATQIGTVGRSGLASGPHLHYEVRVRGEAVDPMRVPVAAR